jgi:Ca-activated chloride channel family protein
MAPMRIFLALVGLTVLLSRVPAGLPVGTDGALAAQDAGQTARFSARTQGVLADVLVTRDGRPVPGLTAADFELRDNGVVQRVDLVEWSDLPINVVVALDVSASTAGDRLTHLRAASHTLLDGLKPGDRTALITFSEAVMPRIALTTDVRSVGAVIDGIAPAGESAIFDGLYAALMAAQAETGRSLVVLSTDGTDTASWLQPGEVIESARRSNAVVYVVATGAARRWAPLKELANTTGGETIELEASRNLADQFASILRLFRSRYVLTYTPMDVATGGFHRLDVRVKRPGMRVKARPGYFAPER